jgi:CBS domain containing-hemolysin-like protein
VAFALITTLHIVLGELAPKGIALQKPEATALIVVFPVSIFLRVFKPFIFLLNGTGNLVLRLLGLQSGSGEENVHSVEELRYLVRASGAAGVIDATEEEIAGRALTLGDLHASKVMVPRTEMASVPVNVTRDELLNLAGREHHMRFPVYEENTDNIVGIIYLTDLFAWEHDHPGADMDLKAIMRPPLFVPESVTGDLLLAQMRTARSHIAIVVDEFGGVAGLVTLQDLLERIVGEIPEIDEEAKPGIEVLLDGTMRVDGLTPLDDLRSRLALAFEGSDAETVGGYVLDLLGRVPEVGEELDLRAYKLKVSEMDGPRVAEVILST